jgi:hypothetical protein
MLFEWLRERWKKQANTENVASIEFYNYAENPFIIQRPFPVFYLRSLAASLVRLWRDHAVKKRLSM